MENKPVVYTIGHSTRRLEEFIDLLRLYSVKALVDIRTVPRSRVNPQFDISSLPAQLKHFNIEYIHLKGLGGFRRSSKDSINTGWRNASFRGFADYMQTPEFEDNLEKLIKLGEAETVAIMCAEAVPWRCHRSLIADALLVRNIEVKHILSHTSLKLHSLTTLAHVDGTKITYSSET